MGPKKAAGGKGGASGGGGKDKEEKKEAKGGTSVNVRVSVVQNYLMSKATLHLTKGSTLVKFIGLWENLQFHGTTALVL